MNDKLDLVETLLGGCIKKHRDRSLEAKQAVLITAEKLVDGRTEDIMKST